MHEQQTAAVLLGAICGVRLQIYITASSPKALIWRPNDLAHWELIAWAASQGLRWFDFGSARYDGQIQFKKKWGAARLFLLLGRPARCLGDRQDPHCADVVQFHADRGKAMEPHGPAAAYASFGRTDSQIPDEIILPEANFSSGLVRQLMTQQIA
jgi:Acetyltransferase (GNAT) domain